jgi:hypothetical protein
VVRPRGPPRPPGTGSARAVRGRVALAPVGLPQNGTHPASAGWPLVLRAVAACWLPRDVVSLSAPQVPAQAAASTATAATATASRPARVRNIAGLMPWPYPELACRQPGDRRDLNRCPPEGPLPATRYPLPAVGGPARHAGSASTTAARQAAQSPAWAPGTCLAPQPRSGRSPATAGTLGRAYDVVLRARPGQQPMTHYLSSTGKTPPDGQRHTYCLVCQCRQQDIWGPWNAGARGGAWH